MLKKTQFLSCDLSGITFSLSGSGTFINSNTVNNLQTYDNLNFVLIGSYNYPALIADFKTPHTADTLIIENHNLQSCSGGNGTVLFQAADDINFTTNLVTISSDITVQDNLPVLVQFSSITKRYWRLFYNANLVDYPRIGNLFIDSVLTFPFTTDWNYVDDGVETNTNSRIAMDGHLVSNSNYDSRQVHEFYFKIFNDKFRKSFTNFISSIKSNLYPFYMIDMDNSVDYMKLYSTYTPVTVQRLGYNSLEKIVLKSYLTENNMFVSNVNLDGPFINDREYSV